MAHWQLENTVTDIIPSPFSDHKAISISIPFKSPENLNRNSAYWKLNNSILHHNEVVTGVEKLILSYWDKAICDKNYCSNWELLKFEIGKFFRKYCSDLAKKRKIDEDTILVNISILLSKK